ncbi:MAG: hypothetical protein RL417_1287 [Pseudomonadota bacterium]|jgi:asparagine synthase (glutamine-hydrolysing)
MCGIVGFVQTPPGELREALDPMTAALYHRGPDAGGAWIDESSRLALGHRRLSILDLSPEGHQPMISPSGRFVITFNGEIYNFAALKRSLAERYHFRGGSDTEVILAAFEEWGVTASLERFVGMFAFAVWDRREHTLTLARDRMGEKPLYYGWNNGTFLFASELGALRAHPRFEAPLNRGAIALLMRHGYISAPYSIYQGIFKLPPGTSLTVGEGALRSLPDSFSPTPDEKLRLSPKRYWSLSEAARRGIEDRRSFDETEVLIELERLLREAVNLQMVADVPLGAFLSGGIDSSLVVALMQSQSTKPIKTFSIGFHEAGFNEADHAARVAQHLGTSHTELYVTPAEALDVINKIPTIYSEPFADSSQIPTYLVARLARRHVTVSLSGDGGDELFGGYPRYLWSNHLWNKIGGIPAPFRRLGGKAALTVPTAQWNGLHQLLRPLLPQSLSFKDLGSKIHRAASLLESPSREALYLSLLSYVDRPDDIVMGGDIPPTDHLTKEIVDTTENFYDYMMLCDGLTYLPDDILVKVDRAGMAVSLESRIPLLDHRVVELAWRFPFDRKIQGDVTKSPLRHILYKYVPRELIERPKMGFGIPFDRWLRHELRPWAEELLSETSLDADGIFAPAFVKARWDEHLSERRNNSYLLWSILTFQNWLRSKGNVGEAIDAPTGRLDRTDFATPLHP